MDTAQTPTPTPATETPANDTPAAADTPAKDTTPGADNATADETPAPDANAPAADGAETVEDKDAGGQPDADAAPETYQFVAPEGMELQAEGVEAFSTLAKELSLSQAKAQSLVNLFGLEMARHLEAHDAAKDAAFKAETDEWVRKVMSDPDVGGSNEKVAANLSVAKLAVDKYGDAELREVLERFQLGNHPAFIRFCFRAGTPLREDTPLHKGDATASNAGKRDADVLWPDGGNKTAV
jgi:hypothetical protein